MPFAKDKHVRYWRMCARGLPDHYTSTDSSRMSLGFFIVSALDLLGVLNTIATDERQSWITWIYSCQVPEGGFRGFTGIDMGSKRSEANRCWDPANLPNTFFALATLLVLGDDLSRVRRTECLEWLPKLQRQDGSFGEVLSEYGVIEGDRDLRQCCCAAGIAYILQDRGQLTPPFDELLLMRYVQSCQNDDGGFGVSPLREPHSGLTYCAIGTLSFLQKIKENPSSEALNYIPSSEHCIKWLLERQTGFIDDEDTDHEDSSDDDNDDTAEKEDERHASKPQYENQDASALPSLYTRIAGFNGRDEKLADTCYSFWNTGALAILGQNSLVDVDGMKRYLLEVTQHQIGGFGKCRGDPPDVLHSYLGLAALALSGHPEIEALDPTMCMSRDSVANLKNISWKRQP